MRVLSWGWVCVVAACDPAIPPPAAPKPPTEVNGGALLVDMHPEGRPRLVGSIDFDLLGQGVGKACVTRAANTVYWVGMNELSALATDPLTQKAIAAAAIDAVTRLENSDTILLTSVVTDSSHDARATCATVVGRGVRLKKVDSPPPAIKEPLFPNAPGPVP